MNGKTLIRKLAIAVFLNAPFNYYSDTENILEFLFKMRTTIRDAALAKDDDNIGLL